MVELESEVYLCFVLKTGSQWVALAVLEPHRDIPAFASRIRDFKCVYHYALLENVF